MDSGAYLQHPVRAWGHPGAMELAQDKLLFMLTSGPLYVGQSDAIAAPGRCSLPRPVVLDLREKGENDVAEPAELSNHTQMYGFLHINQATTTSWLSV